MKSFSDHIENLVRKAEKEFQVDITYSKDGVTVPWIIYQMIKFEKKKVIKQEPEKNPIKNIEEKLKKKEDKK